MATLTEHDPKQTSHTRPAMEWNVDELIEWIQQTENDLLDEDECEKLRRARVSGRAFLRCNGDRNFFKNDCGLSPGTAVVLAYLSRELTKRETTSGIKRNRQQAEDVAVDMKSPRKAEDAFKAGIRYKRPRSLVKSSGKNWVFQPHPDLYKTLAPNVLEHYTQYKNDNVDKTYAPIYFYLGGAGTGKSRHGSEFASSVQEAIRLHAELHAELHTDDSHCDHCNRCDIYNELSQRLKKAFVFHVSFENGTSLIHEEKSKPWNAVGARMLAQLLDQDVDDVREQYIANPKDIFRLVATAEKVDLCNDFTGILVVDGIQKTSMCDGEGKDKQSVFYSFLSQIGDLSLMSRCPSGTEEGGMRQTPFIMTCVTATFFGPAHEFLAETHRKRVYLPLNQLDMPTWKETDLKVFNDDPGTRLLVKDVGGHARAIETIADELTEYQNGFQPNITELANTVLHKLKDRYGEIVDVMGDDVVPVVQCILSRQRIRLRGFIPGSTLRWEHIIAPGLLWFEKASGYEYSYGAEGYLIAPYIWLWLFARVLPTEDERLYQFLTEWEFNDYQRLLHLETGKGPTGKITWQDFETFCCYFRILRSLWFKDEQEVEFKRLHQGCKKLRDDKNTIVVNRRLRYAEAAHQYSTEATSAKDVVTKHDGTLDAEYQLYHVILNGQSASAGDFFLSVQTPARQFTPSWSFRCEIVREVGQSKLVKEKLNQETYNEERNKSAGPADFFILYTTAETPDDIALPDRSGLVDKSSWNSYFGPFAGRAFRYARSQDEEP